MRWLLIFVLFSSPAMAQTTHVFCPTDGDCTWTGTNTFNNLNIANFPNSSVNGIINVKAAPYNAKCDGATDDATAIQSAINAAGTGLIRAVSFPPGICVIGSPINIPLGMTSGSITGAGQISVIQAKSGYSAASMVTADPTLSILTIRDLHFDANNQSSITNVINLTRSPESSIDHRITNLGITNVPAGSIGITLDGCEDTYLIGSYITTSVANAAFTAIHWYVPTGNLHIFGGISLGLVDLEFQSADITGQTVAGIRENGQSLTLNGVYDYAYSGTTKANLFGLNASGIDNVTISGSYFTAANFSGTPQNSVTAIQGPLQGNIFISGTSFDPGGSTGYTVTSSATTAFSGSTPSIEIKGPHLLGSAVDGNPASGIILQSILVAGKRQKLASCTTPASVNGVCGQILTWQANTDSTGAAQPFPDTNYIVNCSYINLTGSAILANLASKTAGTITVNIINTPGNSVASNGEMDCIAVHD